MIRKTVRVYLRERLPEIKEVLKSHPVEIALAAAFFLNLILCKEVDPWSFKDVTAAGPHLFAFVYILDNLFRGSRRWIYYLSWLPLVPLFLVDLSGWAYSAEWAIELISLLLVIPVVKGCRDNRGFVAENWWLFTGITVSLVLCSVAVFLFRALVYCTADLFSLDWYGTRAEMYFTFFGYTIFLAVLLLSYLRRHDGKLPGKTGVLSVLLYYILTPALLAFNTVLYAYIIKILIEWSLPSGNVAIMVFVFALAAYTVKALRELLPAKRYGWYYDNLSFISLPALVLFWVGVTYRLAEYGFTESRVYLVLCGVIMTTALALFVCRGKGRYRPAWIIAASLLAVFTFITPVNAVRIGLWSQERTVVRLATQLDILAAPGQLKQAPLLDGTDPGTIAKFEKLRGPSFTLNPTAGPITGLPTHTGTEAI